MPKSPWMPWPTGSSRRRSNRNRPLERGGTTLPRALPFLLLMLLTLISSPVAAARQTGWVEDNFLRLLKTQLATDREQDSLAELAIVNPLLREQKGRVELSFTLEQGQPTPQPLELLLLIVTPAQNYSATFTSDQASTPLSLLLDDPPTEIRLDPYFEAPRLLSRQETPPTWAGFIKAPRRLAILPQQEAPGSWAPLLAYLAQQEVEVVTPAEIQDRDLTEAALLFLGDGTASSARGYLLQPAYPATAITLEARENPLNPDLPAILLNLPPAAVATELDSLLSHLRGEGIFSKLQLQEGVVRQHALAPTEAGIRVTLDRAPDGIPAAARQDFPSIMAELADTRVIYVGEVHNRYEDHLLQLRVLRAMHRQNPKVAVGMEMFPRSTQPILDAYLAGELEEPRFLKESNWFKNWQFDYRLYREIIDFARHHQLPLIALNLEKGITNKVFREGGISALSPEERAELPPERDLGLPGYRERIKAAFGVHNHDEEEDRQQRFGGFLQAQNLWDEQMAAAMAQFLAAQPDYRMLVVVGQGHTDKRNAIPPRLARRLPVSQQVLVPVRENSAAPAAADFFFFLEPQSLPELPLLGVQISDGEEGAPGALVAGINPHGKAYGAGVRENDLLTALDEQQIEDAADLRIAMLYKERGQTLRVRLSRPPAPQPEEQDEEAPEPTEVEHEIIDITLTL
ncbi:ChaN family lipoprotein [Desulfurivibrio sp. D14AmB]|uniref:ChaN family lipoprotein n=1 Tax=Desulfurivibrio sp. D14AmB TaxID=3374370 RepID=UPI00376F3BDE